MSGSATATRCTAGPLDARSAFFLVVSSTGLGFVGLDVFVTTTVWPEDKERTNDAVVIVANDGTVRHRKLSDLFQRDEMAHFRQTGGGVNGSAAVVDEARPALILVGGNIGTRKAKSPKDRLFRVVIIDSGTVAPGKWVG